jgi:hypothetical protein
LNSDENDLRFRFAMNDSSRILPLSGVSTEAGDLHCFAQTTNDVSDDATRGFRKTYGLRSRLVHSGKPVTVGEVTTLQTRWNRW